MSDDDLDSTSREQSPCSDSPRPTQLEIDNTLDMCTSVVSTTAVTRNSSSGKPHMKVCSIRLEWSSTYESEIGLMGSVCVSGRWCPRFGVTQCSRLLIGSDEIRRVFAHFHLLSATLVKQRQMVFAIGKFEFIQRTMNEAGSMGTMR